MAVFMYLAALGFIASVLIHISTFTAFDPSAFCGAWGLSIGVFVVFIPAVICASQVLKGRTKSEHWKLIFQYVPACMPALMGLFLAYAFFSFLFTSFALLKGGSPGIIDGQYVLQSRGEIIRQLTETEYIRHRAYVLRLFSGHWMAFYLMSFTILLSHVRRTRSPRPSGHDIESN
jgi:hypothetical protein